MMTYSNKFVMCVLVNGRPQKELANGAVSLPFGAEYALRFRNKNDRRAVVKFYIDGENVSGGGYVVDANNFVDIKRHHNLDRAFKFVSLDSSDAVDHGKNGPNPDKVKGTIEARFYLEKEQTQVIYRDVHHCHHHNHYPKPQPLPSPWTPDPSPYTYGRSMESNSNEFTCSSGKSHSPKRRSHKGGAGASCCSMGLSDSYPTLNNPFEPKVDIQSNNFGAEKLQDGCTVEGYSTGQNFHTTHVALEDECTVLKLFLQGYEGELIEAVEPTRLPAKKKPAKDHVIDDLEAENEELRRKVAEMENEKLKQKLEELEK